jgi:FtsH-binding integral membrane protein
MSNSGYYQNRDDYYSRHRSGDRMSLSGYNALIGVLLLWGFVANVLMYHFFVDTFMTWNFTVVIIGYFISCLAGIAMSKYSSNAIVSFIGYNLVVVPVGVILSIALTGFEQVTIMYAIYITGAVTVVMILLSVIFPKVFLSMGRVLGVCLLVVAIVELIALIGARFFGWSYLPTIWDALVALLFCLYIGYDWAKAQEMPRTADNAIDAVVELYLDIINLFIRILEILGDSKRKK